jgi:ferredoxin
MPEEERDVGDLRVRIDRTLCVGFGDCIDDAAAVFELDDDGVVRFRADAPDDVAEAALFAACGACPVDALSAFDDTGRQLAP